MRLVVQRVRRASVWVSGFRYSSISMGLLVFVGFAEGDGADDIIYLSRKLMFLRVFPDSGGRMNSSVVDVGGELMLVSQFTLYGDCRKGRRPSYSSALGGDAALSLYDDFVKELSLYNVPVQTGKFGEMMDIDFVNWGPVTLLLDSRKVF